MNVSEISASHCYGCGICSVVCSEGGVKLQTDKYGYYKSQIIEDKCVNCGKCLAVCPYYNGPKNHNEGDSYVVYAKNRKDVIESTSGGVAHVIAKYYLKMGYTIIGAAWTDDYRKVEHIIIKDEVGLGKLRKSKYVQSYTPNAFRKIGYIDKVVVFGTPCQIAGLRNTYGDRKDLILIDFDCMGPSGLVLWNKYIDYINGKNKFGIKSLEMRNKKYSWIKYGTQIEFGNEKKYFKDKYHDPFCILYHLGHTIQESCIKECKYLNDSKADLRIGDAWNYTDGFSRDRIHDGLSLVMPLTKRGTDVLQNISESIVLKPITRIPNKKISQSCDEKVLNCLLNQSTSIKDVLNAYNDVSILKKTKRTLSNLLSANDTIYLLIKKILKKIRK